MSRYDDLENSPAQPAPASSDPAHYTWYQIWLAAVSQPGTTTYQALLADPAAAAQRGYRWVFATGAILMTVSMIFNPFAEIELFAALLVGPLLGGAFNLIGFIVTNWIIQRIAMVLGAAGAYGQFHYLRAAFIAPLNLVNAVLTPFAIFGADAFSWFSLLLMFFELVLTAVALRAVNQFSWNQAMGTTSIFLLIRLLAASLLGSMLLSIGGF